MLRDTAACKSSTNYVYDLEGKKLVHCDRADTVDKCEEKDSREE